MDEAVADIFGYHAVQLGMPRIDGLRTNRMPHQWLALGADAWLGEFGGADNPDSSVAPRAVALWAEPVALPFPSASLDLVVLPHTLELSEDPHMALREVERALDEIGVQVVSLVRNGTHIVAPRSSRRLHADDILVVEAEADALARLVSDLGLKL